MAKKQTKKEVVEKTTPEVTEVKEPTVAETKEIKVIEKIIENKAIAPADAFGKLTRPQIDLIKRTVAKGASDDELRLFIQVCKGAQLNPFLKQVFLVPRWDSKEGKEVRAIQVSIDGFRAIAESSNAYAGNDDPIFDGESEITFGKEKKSTVKVPDKATVTVWKFVEGQRYGFTATARWSEYYPGEKMGFQWHVRPYLMLGKCAEALALRKAFPKLLSGMYAQEEMEKGTPEMSDESKNKKTYDILVETIKKSDEKELKEWEGKILTSTKYTDKQKGELIKLIGARMLEINKQDVKES